MKVGAEEPGFTCSRKIPLSDVAGKLRNATFAFGSKDGNQQAASLWRKGGRAEAEGSTSSLDFHISSISTLLTVQVSWWPKDPVLMAGTGLLGKGYFLVLVLPW